MAFSNNFYQEKNFINVKNGNRCYINLNNKSITQKSSSIDPNKNDMINQINNTNYIKQDKNQIVKLDSLSDSNIKLIFDKIANKREINAIIFIKTKEDNYINILTCGCDSIINIWSLDDITYDCITTDDMSINALLSIQNEDKDCNKIIISGGTSKDLKFFDFQTKNFLFRLNGHKEPIKSIEKINKNKDILIASGSLDGDIIIWDIFKRELKFRLNDHVQSVNTLIFIDWRINNSTLVSGSSDKTIKIWNIEEKICETTLKGHVAPINDIIFFSANPNFSTEAKTEIRENIFHLLISCSYDLSVILWDIKSRNQLKAFKSNQISALTITNLDVFNKGNFIISAGEDKNIKIWDFDLNAKELSVLLDYLCSDKIKKISKLNFNDKSFLIAGGGIGNNYASLKIWKYNTDFQNDL